MDIQLQERTAAHVSIYWNRTQDPEIRALLPSAAQTEEQALELYRQTLLPGANSFGRVILADGQYVGDIWCYCIDSEEGSAMVSYCIFEKALWNNGIATQAGQLFLREIFDRFGLKTAGAFTYCSNKGSIAVLEHLGFRPGEQWEEDGVLSQYFEVDLQNLR